MATTVAQLIEQAWASIAVQCPDVSEEVIRKQVLKALRARKEKVERKTKGKDVVADMKKILETKYVSFALWKKCAKEAWLQTNPKPVAKQNAFFQFREQKWFELKRDNPTMPFGEMQKLLAAEWKKEKERRALSTTNENTMSDTISLSTPKPKKRKSVTKIVEEASETETAGPSRGRKPSAKPASKTIEDVSTEVEGRTRRTRKIV